MSAIMKISSQRQIRIPKKLMKILSIETGDFVEIDIKGNEIVLKPRKLIDPTQGWYWTKEWQVLEEEADEQVKCNDVSDKFKTLEDAIQWLNK